MKQIDLTEYFTQTQINIPSTQHLREHSLKLNIYLDKKQASTDIRKPK